MKKKQYIVYLDNDKQITTSNGSDIYWGHEDNKRPVGVKLKTALFNDEDKAQEELDRWIAKRGEWGVCEVGEIEDCDKDDYMEIK